MPAGSELNTLAHKQSGQLSLPWEEAALRYDIQETAEASLPEALRTKDGLRSIFEQKAKRPVELFITDNATSLFSMRPSKNGKLTVRLHHMFLRADDAVIAELSGYLRKSRGKTPLFWHFVKQNTHLLRERPPRNVTMTTKGKYHDLREIFDRLNHEYFSGELQCKLTWGNKSRKRVRKSRTLGSYSSHSETIRINPILDNLRVPRYFVDFIMYHEMLHAKLGTEKENGRRALHTPRFKELERRFSQYERAMEWERKNYL